LVVLLDVHLDVPVLLLPLDSASDDRLEVDLGTLQLSNRVLWEMRTEQDSQKLLVDELQVRHQRCAGQLFDATACFSHLS
jgi:vacuolar protein sorting-associated protein 13A/C